jgi:hypothetical protein
MKMVDGIGSDRQKGLDDAKSDDGKDTSLPFHFEVPAGECVNPTVTIPFIGGSYAVSICGYLDSLRTVFTALWGFAFFFASIATVARATAKSS